jgi:hypothetical protein
MHVNEIYLRSFELEPRRIFVHANMSSADQPKETPQVVAVAGILALE